MDHKLWKSVIKIPMLSKIYCLLCPILENYRTQFVSIKLSTGIEHMFTYHYRHHHQHHKHHPPLPTTTNTTHHCPQQLTLPHHFSLSLTKRSLCIICSVWQIYSYNALNPGYYCIYNSYCVALIARINDC